MTAEEIIWTAMAIVVCVIRRICLVIGVSQHLRGGSCRKDRAEIEHCYAACRERIKNKKAAADVARCCFA